MKLRWDKWLYGIGSAFLGGGASAVVSGITSMAAFHVDVTTWAGAIKILSVTGINFVITGAFSMFFYLKQDPLPQVVADGDSNPRAFVKAPEPENKTGI